MVPMSITAGLPGCLLLSSLGVAVAARLLLEAPTGLSEDSWLAGPSTVMLSGGWPAGARLGQGEVDLLSANHQDREVVENTLSQFSG